MYVLYGRKSKRHHWNIYGYAKDADRIRQCQTWFERDAPTWETTLRWYDYDGGMIHEDLPTNTKDLPPNNICAHYMHGDCPQCQVWSENSATQRYPVA